MVAGRHILTDAQLQTNVWEGCTMKKGNLISWKIIALCKWIPVRVLKVTVC